MNGLTQIIGETASHAVTSTSAGRTAMVVKENMFTRRVLPAVGGGAVGAYFWKKHRLLGFLAGMAVGDVAMPLFNGSSDERKSALKRVGVEGAAVVGSLYFGNHFPKWFGSKSVPKVAGYLAGGIVAGTAVTLIARKAA